MVVFDELRRDVRYGVRMLTKSPGFTAVAVLSLALGIGANTAIFSLVNAVILRELPLENPEELVDIFISRPDFPYNVFSYPDFEDLRDGTRDAFTGVAGVSLVLLQVDRDGSVDLLPGEVVSGDYFSLLGVEAHLGRTLLAEDDVAPGAHPVVMLGYGYWQRAFGADPGVVGQVLRLAGRAYTIVGVAPRAYTGSIRGIEPIAYASFMMINELQPTTTDSLTARGNHSIFVKGRLKPGVSLVQAEVAANGVAASLTEDRPVDWDPNAKFLLLPTESVLLYPPFDRFVRAAAWLLTIVVGLVLLLACTNLASFLLARALDRRKEIAVRLALGATRRTLIRQLVVETALLGVAGGVAGVGLAVWLLRLLLAADLPLPVPVTLDLGLDTTVLVFSLTISLGAGIFLGLVPAIQSTNPDVASTLKNETPAGGRRGHLTLRNTLVVTQVAVSVVLLVGAGLFLRSFQRIQSVDPGFGREPSAIMQVLLPTTRYDEDQGKIFTQTMLERFKQLPGVEAVGIIDNLHLNTLSTQTMGVNVDGVEPPPGREAHPADRATVDPGFFDAAGVRILQGRNFNDRDLPESPQVAIISDAMARRFWPGENAVGRTLRRPADPDLRVVGVASDAKIRSLGEPPRSFVYVPYSQHYRSFFTVVARTTGPAERTVRDLVSTSRELDSDLQIWDPKTMERHLAVVQLPARLSALLLSVFAVLALALATVGLYGIVSYAVSQRTREVGIRVALGADSRTVIRMLTGGALKLVLGGSVIGLVLAVAVSRLLGGLLFEVNVLDPVTFITVPVVLGSAALLAAYVPARRASRIDPVTALRAE